jgi:hypothetical protein
LWTTGLGEQPVKKSVGQAPLEQRHAVIASACQENLPLSVRHLCELLEVNRAWYYARQHVIEEPSKLAQAVALRDAIEQIILDFPGYGYRRVTHALQRAGWKVNHKRVLRIMREESLLCHIKRHFVPTTDSRHHLPVYPNLVKGRTPDAPDVIWVADLTYISLRNEFVYLATILDAYSRRCIGWHLSKRIDTHLALGALEEALAPRDLKPGQDEPLRSGCAICQFRVYGTTAQFGDPDQQGCQRQGRRQGQSGEVFQHLQPRGGLPQTVSDL